MLAVKILPQLEDIQTWVEVRRLAKMLAEGFGRFYLKDSSQKELQEYLDQIQLVDKLVGGLLSSASRVKQTTKR